MAGEGREGRKVQKKEIVSVTEHEKMRPFARRAGLFSQDNKNKGDLLATKILLLYFRHIAN